MTLPPGGGPFVDAGRGGGLAGTQPELFATIPDPAAPTGAAGAEALATLPATPGAGAEETPGGAASFEQATASAAPKAERIERRMTREHYCPPPRVPSNRSRRLRLSSRFYESTVIPSFSRSWRYGSLML